MNKSYCTGI